MISSIIGLTHMDSNIYTTSMASRSYFTTPLPARRMNCSLI
uniref:Uncharacterized protein n=1 Tax=Triticum urartu TaxID=4572 RepID=A0A8R7TW11_TRIUA